MCELVWFPTRLDSCLLVLIHVPGASLSSLAHPRLTYLSLLHFLGLLDMDIVVVLMLRRGSGHDEGCCLCRASQLVPLRP